MKEEHIEKIKNRKIKMAICYDFDKTLSPKDMQEFTLIPSFGIDSGEFWTKSNALAKANLMDTNLAWMHQLIKYSEFNGKSIRKEYFKEVGEKVELYKGVDTWFDRINKYAKSRGIEVEHYIISSGLKEIIEGSLISKFFKRIYASTYLYSTDGIAIWPAQAVNYTNKTQFIFRIAKGFLEEYDERVNDSMHDSQLEIPYENIIYIGDSATDIPCMRLVKSKGGHSIGVFDPEKDQRKKVYKLFNDKRIDLYTSADYSARSQLSQYVKLIIDEISAREKKNTEKKILALSADAYKMYSLVEATIEIGAENMTKKQKAKMEDSAKELLGFIDGKID